MSIEKQSELKVSILGSDAKLSLVFGWLSGNFTMLLEMALVMGLMF